MTTTATRLFRRRPFRGIRLALSAAAVVGCTLAAVAAAPSALSCFSAVGCVAIVLASLIAGIRLFEVERNNGTPLRAALRSDHLKIGATAAVASVIATGVQSAGAPHLPPPLLIALGLSLCAHTWWATEQVDLAHHIFVDRDPPRTAEDAPAASAVAAPPPPDERSLEGAVLCAAPAAPEPPAPPVSDGTVPTPIGRLAV